MSSLLEQLRKRRLSETQERSLHVRPSLLFDGKEAARIELTALHLLALDGLEQLKKLDPRIRSFQKTLFSEASKEFTRELQTKEVNQKLDESLRNFLVLLSPFFMLKGAHKVLEYLIRQYKYAMSLAPQPDKRLHFASIHLTVSIFVVTRQHFMHFRSFDVSLVVTCQLAANYHFTCFHSVLKNTFLPCLI